MQFLITDYFVYNPILISFFMNKPIFIFIRFYRYMIWINR
nr:MAG TPA: hypothetical protein [Caudoviricetes sp.]DAX27330.1 MAG TPA: hypothetical protein [Caudoviricetes sp.]